LGNLKGLKSLFIFLAYFVSLQQPIYASIGDNFRQNKRPVDLKQIEGSFVLVSMISAMISAM